MLNTIRTFGKQIDEIKSKIEFKYTRKKKKARNRRYFAETRTETITDADYADNLAFLANTSV